MTKIASKLPAGNYSNGLPAITRELIDDPTKPQLLLVLVDCKATTTDNDTGEIEPTIRIRQIQPVLEEDRRAVSTLLQRAADAHSGKEPLPFDLYNNADEG